MCFSLRFSPLKIDRTDGMKKASTSNAKIATAKIKTKVKGETKLNRRLRWCVTRCVVCLKILHACLCCLVLPNDEKYN